MPERASSAPVRQVREPGLRLRLRDYFVGRLSGAPVDALGVLRARRATELVGLLVNSRHDLLAARASVSERLFARIGGTEDRRSRGRLLKLRRDLHAGRAPDPASLARDLLGRELWQEVQGLLQAESLSAGLQAQLRSTFEEESAEARERFRRLLENPDFRNGLLLSSHSLSGALRSYQSGPSCARDGRSQKIERGLLRYFTRMGMKATPFSTFCRVVPGRLSATCGVRLGGEPARKRSSVRLNKALYQPLWQHLKSRPAVRSRLPVELNPTVSRQDDRLVFLTAVENKEVFQRLVLVPTLDVVVGHLERAGVLSYAELSTLVQLDPRLEATAEEVDAFLDRLVTIGLLRFRAPVREQEAEWDLALVRVLEPVQDEHAQVVVQLLRELRARVERYELEDPDARGRAVSEMREGARAAFSALGMSLAEHVLPLYEDATADSLLEAPAGDWMEDLCTLVDLLLPVAGGLQAQAEMRHFFDQHYGGEGARIPLLRFYEDFYRVHLKEHLRRGARARSGVLPQDGYDLGNPFRLEYATRLQATASRLTEVVRRCWAANAGAEEITISPSELAQVVTGLPRPRGCHSFGVFGQIMPHPGGRARLLARPSFGLGFGRHFSRFLYLFPDDFREQVLMENRGLTDDLLAEICGDAGFNANLHPPLLDWEISYPTGESGTSEAQIPISAIDVVVSDSDRNALELRRRTDGRRVLPVDLGFLTLLRRPPLYQLLTRFGPLSGLHLELPEDSVQRRKATPPAPAPTKPDGGPPATPARSADAGQIVRRPRIVFGRALVLARQRWQVPGALYPVRAVSETDAAYFLRLHEWRHMHGIPEEVYVRILPVRRPGAAAASEADPGPAPTPPDQPVDTASAEEAPEKRARTREPSPGSRPAPARGSRDLVKPQYIDFGAPLLTALFGRLPAGLSEFTAILEERYPGYEGLPEYGGERFAAEMVLQIDVTPEPAREGSTRGADA